jgi:nucleotide-binding universal stress UspA family protein
MKLLLIGLVNLAGLAGLVLPGLAQTASEAGGTDPGYLQVTEERAAKIVAALNLTDTNRAARVQQTIARQYQDLSRIHATRDAQIAAAKNQDPADAAAVAARVKLADAEVASQVVELHRAYLARLATDLNDEQVGQVKDGMTYGVAPLTCRAYLQMFPDLTEPQKQQVLAWLHEAREIAMDAGSSKEKHAVFGKYKGRINNYLVQAGYDLKQGEQNRKKATAAATDTQPK